MSAFEGAIDISNADFLNVFPGFGGPDQITVPVKLITREKEQPAVIQISDHVLIIVEIVQPTDIGRCNKRCVSRGKQQCSVLFETDGRGIAADDLLEAGPSAYALFEKSSVFPCGYCGSVRFQTQQRPAAARNIDDVVRRVGPRIVFGAGNMNSFVKNSSIAAQPCYIFPLRAVPGYDSYVLHCNSVQISSGFILS